MTWKLTAAAFATAALFATGASAQAPSWSKEQTEVWDVVARSWADEVARNGRWPGEYVHDRVVAWDADWPAPRYRDSIAKWSRFAEKQRRVLEYDLAPLAITTVGDTAVAHYGVVEVSQRGEDKPQREAFMAVETLVRTNGQWRFLSLTGFEPAKD